MPNEEGTAPDPRDLRLAKMRQSVRGAYQHEPSKYPDVKTTEEALYLDDLRKQVEIDGLKQDTGERKKYAEYFFLLSCVWVAVVVAFLVLQGFSFKQFKLDSAIVLALIGATTTNILGILYVVANYLFPKK